VIVWCEAAQTQDVRRKAKMKLDIVEELAKHSFIGKVMDDIYPLLFEPVPENARLINKDETLEKAKKILSPTDWYSYDVFRKQGALTLAFTRMIQAHAFLQRFPSPKTYERSFAITNMDWLEYHFLMYMVSVVTTSDCVLILTNSVFRLGLKDGNCNQSSIVENMRVIESKLSPDLKHYLKITGKYRDIRNVHLHRASGKSVADILESQELKFIGTLSFLDLHTTLELPQTVIKDGYQVATDKLIEIIESDSSKLVDQLMKIFGILEMIYLEKKYILNESPTNTCV